MAFYNTLKNLYNKIIFSKYILTHNYRLPSNYNDTSTQFGAKNNWILVKNYICSIGKPSTPTPLGTFKVGAKGYSFGENHGYVCYYYTQFKGNYLFHSIIYNLDNTVRDGRLGFKISNGCIRLAKVNAKWIYDNIPYGTTVYIT